MRHPGVLTRLRFAILTSVLLAAVVMMTLLSAGAAWGVPLPPDTNEPNNDFGDATRLINGSARLGSLESETDMDYFYIDIPGPGQRLVHVTFHPHIIGRNAEIWFRAPGAATPVSVGWKKQVDADGGFVTAGNIGPGRLFIVVSLVGGAAPWGAVYDLTAGFEGAVTFPDVLASSPYYAPISYLGEQGVVSGETDGSFAPLDLVLRQQFAKMIVGGMDAHVYESMVCPFDDLGPDSYYDLYPHEYVAAAALAGVTVGTSGTHFSPFENISMAQVVTMVVRAGEAIGKYAPAPAAYVPAQFGDFGAPHYQFARTGSFNGLFQGYNGPWKWWEPATRGQCAFFVWKMMTAGASPG